MTSCKYLQQLDLATCDEATELVHLNSQLERLDRHIHDLHKLRGAIVHRKNQFLSPIYALPTEVLSHIFREYYINRESNSKTWRRRIHKVVVLSSVSSHWRQVALGMSELWGRLEFCRLTSPRNISSLVRLCASRAPYLKITIHLSVFPSEDNFSRSIQLFAEDYFSRDVRSCTTALFHPDIVPKIKALKVYDPCDEMIELLPSLTSLETLAIQSDGAYNLNLRSFPLLRARLIMPHLRKIAVPSSVRILHLESVPSRPATTLLYQCPRLIEYSYRPKPNESHIPTLTKPVTLNSLERLSCSADVTLGTLSFVQNVQTRSLKTLELTMGRDEPMVPLSIVTFFDQVSATLKSLVLLKYSPPEWLFKSLLKSSLSGLEDLEFRDWEPTSLLRGLLLLTPGDSEMENDHNEQRVPHLKSLTVGNGRRRMVQDVLHSICRAALDLIKKRKAGGTHAFHLDFVFFPDDYRDRRSEFWPVDLKEELREFVEKYEVEVTWNGRKMAY